MRVYALSSAGFLSQASGKLHGPATPYRWKAPTTPREGAKLGRVHAILQSVTGTIQICKLRVLRLKGYRLGKVLSRWKSLKFL